MSLRSGHAALIVASAALACAPPSAPRSGAVSTGSIERGVLPTTWYAGGPVCAIDPPQFQIHAYNEDFYILRQPACTNYEKPFLYLLFGNERVLLLDTGAGKIDVPAAVDSVIHGWLARHHRTSDAALDSMQGTIVRKALADFTIWPQ